MARTPDGALVEAARAGDQRAFGQLFDEWFDRVHDLSRRIVRDDGIAAEVAQDAFLTAWTKLATLDDVDAFGGWLLRISRNASLNRLSRERRSTPTDDETMTAVLDASAPDEDPLARLDQAGRIALVWDAAAALGPRDASVLDLHLRHGMGAPELAEELGTTANNAHQILFTLRKRLGNAVRAIVLWRAGHPTCADLRQSLATAGLTSFGAPMVKAIDRHVDACATCSADRTERLDPAALFAAAPIVAAGVLVKSNAAAALAEAGVPMAGSSATGAGGGGASAGSAGSGSTGPAPTAGAGGPSGAGSAAGVPIPVAGASSGGGDGEGGADSFDDEELGPDGEPRSLGDRLARRRALLVAAVVVLVGVGVALFLAAGADDDPSSVVAAGTTSEPAGSLPAERPGTSAGTPRNGSTSTSTPSTTATTGGTLVIVPGTDADPGGTTGTTPGTVAPGTTPMPPVTTTDPGGSSAPNPPPTTGPGTTPTTVATTPTTTEPPKDPPPVIDRFAVSPSSTRCRGGFRWGVVWATTRADSVTVGRVGTTASTQPADGKTTLCAPANSSFELRATGPGGTASRTVQGQGPASTATTSPSIVITPRLAADPPA